MIFVFGLVSMVVASVVNVDIYNPQIPHSIMRSTGLTDATEFENPLSIDGKIMLHWWLDETIRVITMRITFEESVSKFDWFAFGFSDRGLFVNSDFCVLTLKGNKPLLKDYNTNDAEELIEDERNDCLDPHWIEKTRTFQFSRYFDTCELGDYIILNGTTHIVWAKGLNDPNIKEAGGQDRNMVRVQLLKVNKTQLADLPEETKVWSVNLVDFAVPAADTTYQCKVFEMPDYLQKTTHHLIRYESIISEGNEDLIHHMEIFYCDDKSETKIDMHYGSCFDAEKPQSISVCTRVKAAWAMGAGPFDYPKEAGLSIGGPESNKYVMLEVHYNNPNMIEGRIDSSGVRVYLVPTLRKYEASIIELGLEYIDKMMIPPGQQSFQLTSFCSSDCTKTGLPKGGIFIFGSQLHTHTTGVSVKTRQFRDGIELETGIEDDHFHTDFQEIRVLRKPVYIRPGDSLRTECIFKTDKRKQITYGGFSIQEEMCVNYVHYYPAADLEVCKSSVSTKAMREFWEWAKEEGKFETSPNKTVRENYDAITPWTTERVKKVYDLFHEAPISMQCNKSDGTRFPGEWEYNPIDPVVMELPPRPEVCPPYIHIHHHG